MTNSGRFSWERLSILAFLLTMALAIVVIALARPSVDVVAALTLVAVALALMVRWHAKRTAYCCPACQRRFTLSAWQDFLHPHWGYAKYVRCPRCGASGWCEEDSERGR